MVDQYIEVLKSEEEPREGAIDEWIAFKKQLSDIVLDAEIQHVGVPLESLNGMVFVISRRLARDGIVTVEELLEKYQDMDDVEVSGYIRELLVTILDQNGYRFANCSKEQWPDVQDYLMARRAEKCSLEALNLSDEITELLKNAGLTVSKLVCERWEYLKELLELRDTAIVLIALDNQRLRMKGMPKQSDVTISEFIAHNVDIPISQLGLSTSLYQKLHQRYIETTSRLIELSRADLFANKVVGATAMKELVNSLAELRLHLKDDTFYTCTSCDAEFVGIKDSCEEHFCDDCYERIKRVRRMKDFVVTVDPPDYGSYTDGTKGFTIYATVHNKSKKMAEVKLKEFMLFCDNRQWTPMNNFVGYAFISEHILPNSSKTAGKVWSGLKWRDKRLEDGDYVCFTISVKEKVMAYKFVLKNGKFEINDYHTY